MIIHRPKLWRNERNVKRDFLNQSEELTRGIVEGSEGVVIGLGQDNTMC